jgi:prepilin-type N-terminal cleavage/methylation domain-containing protein
MDMHMTAKRSTGFTIIELIVALAITLVVAAVALSALVDFERTSEGIVLAANTQENLRAGMNYIVRDILLTGEGLPTGGIAIPNGAGVAINRPGPPAAGYTFPLTYTSIPAITPGAAMGANVVEPSDMITVMYADNSIPLSQNLINDPAPPAGDPVCNGAIDPAGASVTFDINCTNISNGVMVIHPGDLILFSNAQGNALEEVTTVAGQKLNFAANDAFNLNQRNDPSGTMHQIQAPAGSGNYPPTTATRVVMVTYYIDNSIANDPRLMREVNFGTPEPLAEDVEDLQASYDFIDGVTNPTDLKVPLPGDSPNQAEDVNLFLAARSSQQFSWNNQYFRNNLVTQVSLRGMAYFNRYN